MDNTAKELQQEKLVLDQQYQNLLNKLESIIRMIKSRRNPTLKLVEKE